MALRKFQKKHFGNSCTKSDASAYEQIDDLFKTTSDLQTNLHLAKVFFFVNASCRIVLKYVGFFSFRFYSK